MAKGKFTIDDLLAALSREPEGKKARESMGLENSAETWSRIGSKDSFEELGLTSSELSTFLKDWVAENPYSNI